MSTVHFLTDPTPGLSHVTVVCGARLPEYGSWDHRAVTCPACLAPSHAPAQASSDLTEKAWLQQVRTLARTHGWLTYHPLRSQGSEPGWVDLVLLRGPVLWCVELKSATGKVTPAQQQWLDGLAQVTSVHSGVWRPGDWDTIQEMCR